MATPSPALAAVVAPCPRRRIEFIICSETDEPIEGVLVRIYANPSSKADHVSDANGYVGFSELDAELYQYSLPEIDASLWVEHARQPIPHTDEPLGAPLWSACPPVNDQVRHVEAAQGDCITSIAFREGLPADVIWNHPANQHLRDTRESPNTLFEKDSVAIPPLRLERKPCSPGNRYILRRAATMATISVRFLDYLRKPRAHVPYLFLIQMPDGLPVLDRRGETGPDGFINEIIPATAIGGEIWLGQADDLEIWPVQLGTARPASHHDGLATRLRNLGYLPAGPSAENLSAAIRRFQHDHALPVTGEPNGTTIAAIRQAHLS